MLVFVNGRIVPEDEAVISVFDRSFLYGDGLFETLRVTNGVPFRWEQHLERLKHGADFLKLRLPHSTAELRRFVEELVTANQLPEAILRLTLSRGVGRRGYSPAGADRPSLVMSVHPLQSPEQEEPPRWRLVTASLRLPAHERLARFKTCNKLPQVLARAEAEAAGGDEALLLNTDGFIVEAASSNLFWLANGSVRTPPLDSGVLAGVTRAVIRELCQSLGLPVEEANLTREELMKTEGVFLSLSSVGVAEGIALDQQELRRSPVTREIHGAYRTLMREETLGGASRSKRQAPAGRLANVARTASPQPRSRKG